MKSQRVLAFAVLCIAGLTLPACAKSEPQAEVTVPPVDPAFVEGARAASNRLRMELQQELGAAMQEGGAVAAIQVCHTRAAQIAADVSASTDLDVQRVSTRSRNSLNHADAVEEAVIAQFERRPAFVDTSFVHNGQPVYMRAIRIESATCLACHGPTDAFAPELQIELAVHYPDDQATGFAAGDVRGAFVVKP